MPINNTQEHISLLREYYAYDEGKKTFTIPITYDKAEDLLDSDVMDPHNHPKFKKEAMENVKEILLNLPTGTKADIQLRIEDYQGYDPDVLLSSFGEAIKLNQHRSRLEQKRSGLTATVLALIGGAILFVYIFGRFNGWYGEEGVSMSYDFITEVLDIVAWVFLWEAVSVLFLYGDDYRSINAGLFIKINMIGFYDKTGEKLLSHEFMMDEVKRNSVAKKWELIGKNMILLASVAMLMSGAFAIFNCVYTMIAFHFDDAQLETILVVALCIGALVGVLFIMLGLGGIFHYLDRQKLTKFTFVTVIVLGVLLLTYLVSSIVSGQAEQISSMAFSIVIYLIFASGYFLSLFFSREKKK